MSKPKTWVTADSHFFHKNIIKYVDRPVFFDDSGVEKMNLLIMDMLIYHCKSGDTLWHLGDLYFGGKQKGEEVANMLGACHARKNLVIGNHDNLNSWPDTLLYQFDQILDAKILHVPRMEIIMTHRPMLIDKHWKGDIVNLHGHVHGVTHNPPGRLDIGVDPAWKYFGVPRPFELEEAIRMALEDHPQTHKSKPQV